MRRSTDRIVTTHTGSLPRPPSLVEPLQAKDNRKAYDENLATLVRKSIFDVVRLQADTGIDVIGDGEHSKSSFTHYLGTRLSGIVRAEKPYQTYATTRDYLAFPG